MQVFKERGKPEYLGKNLSEQSRGLTKSTPIMMPGLGNQTRATLVGGRCSLHYTTTALQLHYRKFWKKLNVKASKIQIWLLFTLFNHLKVSQGIGLLYTYGIAGFDIIIISSTWENNNNTTRQMAFFCHWCLSWKLWTGSSHFGLKQEYDTKS